MTTVQKKSWSQLVKVQHNDVFGIEDMNAQNKAVYYVVHIPNKVKHMLFFQQLERGDALDINDFGNILDYGYGSLPDGLVKSWADKV